MSLPAAARAPLLPAQSLPEEEQQRVLGEEKMLNINKKQTTSPASKKPSQEGGKVCATGQPRTVERPTGR